MSLKKLVQKVILITLLTPVYLNGQIKLDGPVQVEPGELAQIKIDGIKGLNDPKVDCFPKNSSWAAVKLLDDSPIIMFSTKKEGLYTFVVAGNKDNKTYFEVIQVQVGKATPNPGPGPKPPDLGKYTQRLTPQYMVFPDNASLTKLVAVYQSIANRSSSVTSYKQLNEALAQATKVAIGDSALRGVRDEVALILQSDLANRNSQAYDPVATAAIFNELVKSLTPLLEK